MSWIESHPDVFGSYNLTKLKVDEAILNISSSYSSSLWLYELSTNCLKCPYKLIKEIAPLDVVGSLGTISTAFPIQYRIRTNGNETYIPADNDPHKFCDVSHNFGEFGVYELHAGEVLENSECKVDTVLDSVNIYLPLVIALIVFLVLEILLWGINKYEKKIRKSIYDKICLKFGGRKGSDDSSTESGARLGDDDVQKPSSNTNSRLSSLDTFRGICIILMIWVHDGGASYNFMQHATWDGLTVADLILPWFLWIMGVCIPISIKSSYKRNVSTKTLIKQTTIRSLKLFGIGLSMNTIGGSATDLRYYRFFAILQRLAVSNFVANLLAILCLKEHFRSQSGNYFRRNSSVEKVTAFFKDVLLLWKGWFVIALCVMVHTLVIFFLEVPGCPTGYLGPGGLHENRKYPFECIGGATGYIDRKIWGNSHIYKWPTAIDFYGEPGNSVPFDPEGTLGYLTTFLQVWSGVQTGVTLLMFGGQQGSNPGSTWWNVALRWVIWGVLQGLVSGLLCDWKQTGGVIPVNKNLFSLSFVLATNCMALLMLTFLYFIVDWVQIWDGSPFKEPGQNSILLYIVHLVIQKMAPWHWAYGEMQTHFMRLVESLWGISLWVCLGIWLVRKKIFLKI